MKIQILKEKKTALAPQRQRSAHNYNKRPHLKKIAIYITLGARYVNKEKELYIYFNYRSSSSTSNVSCRAAEINALCTGGTYITPR